MADICLYAYHGGLGDNLQFSTLPELYTNAGHDVYIWDRAYFRNPEILDFVWKTNPFIKGLKGGTWNAGDYPGLVLENVAGNAIGNWEHAHGFPVTHRYPKIYHKPCIREEYRDCVLVDLSTISVGFQLEYLMPLFAEAKKQVAGRPLVEVGFSRPINVRQNIDIAHNGKHQSFSADTDDHVTLSSLAHYFDILCSAAGIITLHSGAHALAAAAFEYNPELQVYSITTPEAYHTEKRRGTFIFDGVHYLMQ